MEIKKKLITKDCGCTHQLPNKKIEANPDCNSCQGTGKLEDSIYYHIANGMCFDGDTIK
jgi:hypothetical protein